MSDGVRVCGLVPTLDNPRTVRGVVQALRSHLETIVLVDDGSGDAGRTTCQQLADEGLVQLVRLPRNRGKGAACKAGMARAVELGFTHALQVDADGQHDLAAAPDFLRAAAAAPTALVLARPIYDATAPRVRLAARKVTKFWVDLEIGRTDVVDDAMIGFRVYPLAATLAAGTRGNRMEWDVEIVVRLARGGVPIVNLPVHVRYLTTDEGGISHFRPIADNLRLSGMHARICTGMMITWFLDLFRRPTPRLR
jgi:glycosyltransferase involved in cell wall biosynthesis